MKDFRTLLNVSLGILLLSQNTFSSVEDTKNDEKRNKRTYNKIQLIDPGNDGVIDEEDHRES